MARLKKDRTYLFNKVSKAQLEEVYITQLNSKPRTCKILGINSSELEVLLDTYQCRKTKEQADLTGLKTTDSLTYQIKHFPERFPSYEQLKDEYIVKYKTIKDSALALGISTYLFSCLLDHYNIPRKISQSLSDVKTRVTKDILYEEYILKNQSKAVVCQLLDITIDNLSTLLKEWDIQKSVKDYVDCGKQTLYNRYGEDNAMRTEKGKRSFSASMRRAYASGNVHRSVGRSLYHYDDVAFDSSWELCYYIWLKDHSIDFRFHDVVLEYSIEDNFHTYIPDFYLLETKQFIEIKGDHLIDKDDNLITPYKCDNMEDIRKRDNAKTECMLKNNVVIYTSKEMAPILNYVSATYGVDFVASCKVDNKRRNV